MTPDIKQLRGTERLIRLDCLFDGKPGCVCSHCEASDTIARLAAERDRLKAALSKKLSAKARQRLGDLSESMIAMGDGRSLEMLLNWYDESRKALGGDA